jgi:AAA15 family ATPase/GTPase
MYKSYAVKDFRGFKELHLDNLGRINLIAGKNNVGKTALLESLFIYCGAYSPQLILNLDILRGLVNIKVELGQWTEPPWNSIFRNFDTTNTVELTGINSQGRQRSITLRMVKNQNELFKLGQSITRSLKSNIISLSNESAHVLEFQHCENKDIKKYYLILDKSGIHPIPIPPPPPKQAFLLPARMPSTAVQEEAELYGKLEVQGLSGEIVKVLKNIDSRLEKISMVVNAGQPIIHGDIGQNRLMPLPLMGDGMTRLASYVLRIGNAPGGVVLLDEVENGIHHTALKSVWKAVGEVAERFDTQVFATTHSLECIREAHEAFNGKKPDFFKIHRLERIGEEIKATTYDKDTIEAAFEMGVEVR